MQTALSPGYSEQVLPQRDSSLPAASLPAAASVPASRAATVAIDAPFDAPRPTSELGREFEAAAEKIKPSVGQRLVALDSARVFATFGVMWTHVLEVQGHGSEITALGRFGTSFYIIAAVFLTTRSSIKHPERSWWNGVTLRAKRLLVPFLLWSAIYAAYYYCRLLPRDDIDLGKLSVWWGPFAGCARHLWFLPFAFFATAVAGAVAPRMARWSTRRVVLATLAASAFSYWFCYRVLFFALDRYWLVDWHLHRLDRWIDEAPLLVAALGIAVLFNRRDMPSAPSATSDSLVPSGIRQRLDGPARRLNDWAARVIESVTSHRHVARARVLMTVMKHHPAALRAGDWWQVARVRIVSFARTQNASMWLFGGFLLAQALYMTNYDAIHEATHTQGRFMANVAGLCLLGAFLLATPRRWMSKLAGLGRYTYFAFLIHVLIIDWAFWRLSGLSGFGSIAFGALSSLALLLVAVQLGAIVRKVKPLRWLTP